MRRFQWTLPAALATAALVAAPAAAPAQDVEIEIDAQPIKVGDAVPRFKLRDLDDNERDLSEYLEEDKIVVLEFFDPHVIGSGSEQAPTKALRDTYERMEDEYDDRVAWFVVVRTAFPEAEEPHEADELEDLGDQLDDAREEQIDRLREMFEATDIDDEDRILMDVDGQLADMFGVDKDDYKVAIVDTGGRLAFLGPAAPDEAGEENYVAEAIEALMAGDAVPHPHGKTTTLPAGAPRDDHQKKD